MTNELLAEYIQQGGNDELIPILWEKVRKLLYSKSDSLYRLHKESCSCRGVEMWDIRQASYTAFLEAIKAYIQKKVLFHFLPEEFRKHSLNSLNSLCKPIYSQKQPGNNFKKHSLDIP